MILPATAPELMVSEQRYRYEGSELEVFQHATRWKRYFKSQISPWIRGNVLEVGAGIGATTRHLCKPPACTWVALEPDGALADKLRGSLAADPPPVPVHVKEGTISNLPVEKLFDCVLYIDVLEHIEADRAELSRAVRRLAPGGVLIVLSPAHPWLYSEFDRQIGHCRRYTRTSLRAAAPSEVEEERVFYLDSAGMLASVGNKVLLRQSLPTASQIAFWDTWLVRASQWLDPLLGYSLGKSVIGIWRKAES